ncbi:6-carboxytetrahydropterin synthase QueD [Kiritimatiella glycovorans]|uniref:6-carboxy-5,6,7,8-tetrahydropterin synthase n=1 Tax=Kiritimatiella glycovorans TaxID=1307763 RepID=A0A0G3EHS9_9BACT|nr:6-carboxytetrahydropterin synthase QueD [Kiritimatiella glycovorans]AKJ64355.1 6-carboxy-5,6,7,8-tetrahydropterin synthase [Kiritimatiella glycovorans]
MPTTELYCTFRFSAAHRLPSSGEEHKCRATHGHTFELVVTVAGEPDAEKGWVLDFADLRAAVDPVVAELDHKTLNDIPGLENPTSEHLCRWFWGRLIDALPGLAEIEVKESPECGCRYRGGGTG